jgi:hypothetical protein
LLGEKKGCIARKYGILSGMNQEGLFGATIGSGDNLPEKKKVPAASFETVNDFLTEKYPAAKGLLADFSAEEFGLLDRYIKSASGGGPTLSGLPDLYARTRGRINVNLTELGNTLSEWRAVRKAEIQKPTADQEWAQGKVRSRIAAKISELLDAA